MKGDGRKNRERPLERKNKKHGKKETREIKKDAMPILQASDGGFGI